MQNFVFAYVDSDFDGVEDRYDKCPNTPFSDLVDKDGCTIKKIPIAQEVGKLTLLFGVNYSNYHSQYANKTKTLSQSLELDYEIQKIKIMLNIARFNSKNEPLKQYDDSSFADTRLSLLYTLNQKIPNLSISLKGGIAIPNYKGAMGNNGFDFFYGISTNYFVNKTSLFASYTYTRIGDKDLTYLTYQNTNALSFGVGYSFTPELYSSLSYYLSDSIIKSAKKIRNISSFTYYNINKKLFSTLSLSHDLDKDVINNSYGMQLGYRM
jgi:predicted porin